MGHHGSGWLDVVLRCAVVLDGLCCEAHLRWRKVPSSDFSNKWFSLPELGHRYCGSILFLPCLALKAGSCTLPCVENVPVLG